MPWFCHYLPVLLNKLGLSSIFIHTLTLEGVLFYEKLNNFRNNNENDRQYAYRLGVSRQVFSLWKQGIHRPNRGKFQHILDVLGATEEQFWTRNNKQN